MSFWSALFNGGDASDDVAEGEKEDFDWGLKALSLGGEIVDRAAGIAVNTGATLGGVGAVVINEGRSQVNDIGLDLNWYSEAEYEENQKKIDAAQEGAKLFTAMSAVNLAETLDPRSVDLDQRLEDSGNLWDVFFSDTSEDVGNSITAFKFGADKVLDNETMDPDELKDLREKVALIEDEVLLAIFMFVPAALIPQLRILLAAAAPGMLNLVIQAAASGTNLALDVINFFLERLGLDPVSEEETEDEEEEPEEEEEEEEEVDEVEEPEELVEDKTPMPEQDLEPSIFEETWPEGNVYMGIETIY